MAVNRISTYGFSLSMIAKNAGLQKQLVDLQQQIATGVKSQDLKGYGVDALRLQNARIDTSALDSYVFNIQTATTRIKQMNLNVQEAQKQAENVLDAMTILPTEGDVDLANLKTLANNARDVIVQLMNDKIGEDYLFAGSDIKNKPYANDSSLTARIQTQIASFMDGTNDVDTFLANVDGYTDSQTGFSLGVQDSRNINVRADDNFEVDYTVKANDSGFKDILTSLTVLAELEVPNEETDLATRDDFFKAVNTLFERIKGGVDALRTSEIKLSSAEATIGRKLENHVADKGYLSSMIEDIQYVDPAEAVVKFQALQTQLEAAFQATSIISGLSLARML